MSETTETDDCLLPIFTGRVFRKTQIGKDIGDPAPEFQFEAEINEVITRLGSCDDFPEDCLFNRMHSGIFNLEISILEIRVPLQYHIECKCGESWTMVDPNHCMKDIELT